MPLLLVLVAALLPQSPAPGRIVDGVACQGDPSHTYALYLPAAYTAERRWPVLFVFDPRGDGAGAAERFRAAAERHGWVIASSNTTRSDGGWEPNRRALAAMWPDVLQRVAADERRIYAAGFSGGAGVALTLSRTVGGLAGVIAVGAPWVEEAVEAPRPKAVVAAAGYRDFNFRDAHRLHEKMGASGVASRLETFDGRHEWFPATLAARAVGWLDLLAIKAALKPVDEDLIAELLAAEMSRAASLQAEGRLVDARRAYAVIVDSFAGMASVDTAAAKLREIESSAAYSRAAREEERLGQRERAAVESAVRVLSRIFEPDPPGASQLAGELRIADIRARVARGSGAEAESARRLLDLLFAQTSFNIPSDFAAQKEFERAALSLEVAALIDPDRPYVWYELAAMRAILGARRPAAAALERAADAGFRDAARLEGDARFDRIRDTPEFARVLERLRSR